MDKQPPPAHAALSQSRLRVLLKVHRLSAISGRQVVPASQFPRMEVNVMTALARAGFLTETPEDVPRGIDRGFAVNARGRDVASLYILS